jgi:hypothetical protein
VEYAQQGSIIAETMVWAEGMAEWVPASQIPGLMPEAPVAAVAVVKPAAAWAPPGSRLAVGGGAVAGARAVSPYAVAQAPIGGEYPQVAVKKSSFGLWLWTFVGGFICFVIALIAMITGAVRATSSVSTSSESVYITPAETALTPDTSETAVTPDPAVTPDQADPAVTPDPAESVDIDEAAAVEAAATFGLGGILFFIGWAAMMVSWIFFYINIYRAWLCLQAGAPSTTPGKAVGFLFIPFFNIYWIFVAINGLPKDWNRIVASYDDLKAAPKLSETTFLMFCIGMFFAPLALIMVFPMMSQLCKGINFFAARRNAIANSGYSAFGGR